MSAEQSRAFVVGIEVYAFGGLWNRLSGPVADAHRFVAWLVSHGVKPADITVFLSAPSRPLAADVPPLPAGVQRCEPTEAAFKAAVINDLAKAAPRWFWLYWGGHGVLDDEQRYLLFSDAHQDSAACLDPDDLWRFLRSVKATPKPDFVPSRGAPVLQHTLMILDVCSTHAHRSGLQGTLAPVAFGGGKAKEEARERSYLVASRKGEAAENTNAEQTGVFSRELRSVLPPPAPGLAWPPDFAALDQQLRARFQNLLATGQARQLPAFYQNESPTGEGPTLRGAGFDPDLPRLLQLTQSAPLALPDAAVVEAYRLVTLATQLDFLQWIQPGAAWAALTERLLNRPPSALLKFVELCRPLMADAAVSDAVGEWQDNVAASEGVDLHEVRQWAAPLLARVQAAAQQRTAWLQIVVEPLPGGEYQMRGQRSDGGPFHQESPISHPDQLAQQFQRLFARTQPPNGRSADRLEIALPFELYAECPEAWPICTGQNARRQPKLEPVGHHYPLVLRSYDLAFGDPDQLLEPRTRRRTRGTPPAQPLPAQAIAGPDTVSAALAGQTEVWRTPTVRALAAGVFDPSQAIGNDLTLASELTDSGLPLALWVRTSTLTPAALEQWFQQEFLAHPPTEWPRRTVTLRRQPAGWTGLTVLWDPHDSPLPAAPNRQSHPVKNPSV